MSLNHISICIFQKIWIDFILLFLFLWVISFFFLEHTGKPDTHNWGNLLHIDIILLLILMILLISLTKKNDTINLNSNSSSCLAIHIIFILVLLPTCRHFIFQLWVGNNLALTKKKCCTCQLCIKCFQTVP